MSGDLKERIEQMLAGLGSTADEIAETLHRQDVTGTRDDCWHCPIANLISDRIPGADKWRVEEFGVNDQFVTIPDGTVLLPPAVSEFVTQFDLGTYPLLDDDYDWETGRAER